MKWLVVLLILLNGALFSYFKWGVHPVEAPPQPEIEPYRLSLLSEQQLAQLKKKETVAPAPAEAGSPQVVGPIVAAQCFTWGSFIAQDANKAKSELDKLGIENAAQHPTPQEAIRYWVYIPPRKNQQAAQTKVDELKALGIEDTYIVQEPKWRFAISLGLFKEETLATKFLEDLLKRGVKSAVKGQRNHDGEQTVFSVKITPPNNSEVINKLLPDFPGTELKSQPCS